MDKKARKETPKPGLLIRVHLTDGSVESFEQVNGAAAELLCKSIEPARLFNQSRLVVAGEHYKSVFASAQVVRIDFVRENADYWPFQGDYSDAVELSEDEFRRHARLDQPKKMVKRKERTPPGDLLVSFLKLKLTGGKPLYLMVEFAVKLPAENQSFMQFLLSKESFHMRLRGGGHSVVNLTNLISYTVYPGVAQIPGDSWIAEQVS